MKFAILPKKRPMGADTDTKSKKIYLLILFFLLKRYVATIIPINPSIYTENLPDTFNILDKIFFEWLPIENNQIFFKCFYLINIIIFANCHANKTNIPPQKLLICQI